MAKRTRRQFTAKELDQIETMAAHRTPRRVMAALMELSEDYFNELAKKDDALSHALKTGEAKGSGKAWQSLFEEAVVKRNPKLLMFWMKTQEGVRETTRLEITGKDGAPIRSIVELTPAQRREKVDKLRGLLDRIDRTKQVDHTKPPEGKAAKK